MSEEYIILEPEPTDYQAAFIKIAAVVAAVSRWTGALMQAEGFDILDEWKAWWIPLSAIMAAAMAVVEAVAFAYVFRAWREKDDNRLLWLAMASAVVFVLVLAPYVAAQVRQVELAVILNADFMLWAWSIAVAASTILIVASVGYAERKVTTETSAVAPAYAYDSAPVLQETTAMRCWCGATVEDDTSYRTHVMAYHRAEALSHGGPYAARVAMRERYIEVIPSADFVFPSVMDWTMIMGED